MKMHTSTQLHCYCVLYVTMVTYHTNIKETEVQQKRVKLQRNKDLFSNIFEFKCIPVFTDIGF